MNDMAAKTTPVMYASHPWTQIGSVYVPSHTRAEVLVEGQADEGYSYHCGGEASKHSEV